MEHQAQSHPSIHHEPREGNDGTCENQSTSLHQNQAPFHLQLCTDSKDGAAAFTVQWGSEEKPIKSTLRVCSEAGRFITHDFLQEDGLADPGYFVKLHKWVRRTCWMLVLHGKRVYLGFFREAGNVREALMYQCFPFLFSSALESHFFQGEKWSLFCPEVPQALLGLLTWAKSWSPNREKQYKNPSGIRAPRPLAQCWLQNFTWSLCLKQLSSSLVITPPLEENPLSSFMWSHSQNPRII